MNTTSVLDTKTSAIKWLIALFFILKLAGGYGIWHYYENNYNREKADVIKYYDDALILKEGIEEHPKLLIPLLIFEKYDDPFFKKTTFDCKNWNSSNANLYFRGNRLMIRVNLLLSYLSRDTYFLHLLFFTALSFIGLFWIADYLPIQSNTLKLTLLGLLTLTPSLLFWSSGILKESLIVFLFGFLVKKYYPKGQRKRSLIFCALAIVLIFLIKPYIGVCLIPAVMISSLIRVTKGNTLKSLFIGTTIAIVSVLLLGNILTDKINRKKQDFLILSDQENALSTFETPAIENSWDLIYKAPLAINNTLLRPSIFEIKKRTYIPFAIESLVLITFLILFLLKKTKHWHRKKITLPAIFFILSICLIVGTSIPIFGATVRYRMPAILALHSIIFLSLDINKLSFFKKS